MTIAKTHIPRAARIKTIVERRFEPLELELVDESARHAGHAGASPSGETHFRLRLVSAAFEGLSRVARHRAVTEALADEFSTGLHALSLDLKTPDEAGV